MHFIVKHLINGIFPQPQSRLQSQALAEGFIADATEGIRASNSSRWKVSSLQSFGVQ
jgi:hypothetical protein